MIQPRSIDEVRQLTRRRAAVGRVIAGRPSDDPRASCLGRVACIGPGEAWPTADGRPLAALAQLNLTESPFAPTELAGFAFIAAWIATRDGEPIVPDDRPNGDGWEVRAYRSLDDLVGVAGPILDGVRPRQLEWEVVDDYPAWEDLVGIVEPARLDELLGGGTVADLIGSPASGTKLGGWPTLIQGEILWAPDNRHPRSPAYAFQIDSEERVGLGLWDSGVLHVGIGALDDRAVWVAESQCM